MRTMAVMVTMTATTPRGWHPVLTGSLRVRLRPTSMLRGQEPQREGQAGLTSVNRGSHPHAAPALIVPQSLRQAWLSLIPNLLPRLRRATGLSP